MVIFLGLSLGPLRLHDSGPFQVVLMDVRASSRIPPIFSTRSFSFFEMSHRS